MYTNRVILAAVAFAAFAFGMLAGSGLAKADADGYLQALRDGGQIVLPWTESTWLTSGRMACQELRDGVPYDEIARQYVFNVNAAVAIQAAQEHLCPSTLTAGPVIR